MFVHFGPDGTACLDRAGTACLDRAGKRIWTNDQLRYDSVHGAGGSPVFAGSQFIFLCDGAADPFVVALERKSGTVAWRTPRPPITSPKWSFGTPLMIEVEGERQLVSPDLSEPILASCAMADGAIFVRTESSLYRIK